MIKIRKTNLVITPLLIISLLSAMTFPIIVEASPMAQAEILSTSSFYNEFGDFYVVGEVENTGDVNLQHVMLTGFFYDEYGFVDTDFIEADIYVLVPGQKSPFEIILLTDGGQVDHYHILVTYQTINKNPYREFEILSQSDYIDDSGDLHVVGEVKNTGNIDAPFVSLIATFYDFEGTVIGRDLDPIYPGDLKAGNTAPFDLSPIFIQDIKEIDHYTIQVQCDYCRWFGEADSIEEINK